jgi:hypothetical protein
MINPNCTICHGIGWVCENHPEKAWDKEIGYDCGAGMDLGSYKYCTLEQARDLAYKARRQIRLGRGYQS